MGKKRRVKVVKVKKNSGKIKNTKSLELSNGLKFRSKLELYTYNKLLEADINDFKYEVDKFTLMEAFEFPNESIEAFETNKKDLGKSKYFADVDRKIRSMTYLPDFTNVNHTTKTGWILEVKGYSNDAFPLKWKLFKQWLVKNNYNVDLYKPNNQQNVLKCIQMIKDKYYGEIPVNNRA